MSFKVVAVSGSLGHPSKTESLIQNILNELHRFVQVDIHFIKLSEIGRDLGGALQRSELPLRIQNDLLQIESADLLIVGTPVYKGSFAGLFKHFFDFVEPKALIDVPVLLSASGGSQRHALVIEHHLRPLFSFFQAHTLPLGIYATDQDFASDYSIENKELKVRIALSISRAIPFLAHQHISLPPPRVPHTFKILEA